MTAEPVLTAAHLQRLQTWFGPSFPVGAFSYSHGLEAAFEAGLVTDRESLTEWLEGLLLFGSARNDAILFAEAYRRFPEVAEVAELAAALSPSMELRVETLNQGTAFLRAARQGWPDLFQENRTDPRKAARPERGLPGGGAKAEGDPGPRCARPGIGEVLAGEISLPIAAGVCCSAAQIPLKPALTAYLHAFAANIVSAALRCIPLGQSHGVAVQAALEPLVEAAADQALAATLDDIGSAAPMLDWLSATHETQYSRLFRS